MSSSCICHQAGMGNPAVTFKGLKKHQISGFQFIHANFLTHLALLLGCPGNIDVYGLKAAHQQAGAIHSQGGSASKFVRRSNVRSCPGNHDIYFLLTGQSFRSGAGSNQKMSILLKPGINLYFLFEEHFKSSKRSIVEHILYHPAQITNSGFKIQKWKFYY
jgi:hypothetical protein